MALTGAATGTVKKTDRFTVTESPAFPPKQARTMSAIFSAVPSFRTSDGCAALPTHWIPCPRAAPHAAIARTHHSTARRRRIASEYQTAAREFYKLRLRKLQI